MFASQRTANAFGYIALTLLVLLLVLDYGLHILPPHLRLPIFFLALAMFLIRVTLRLLLARRARAAEEDAPPAPDRTDSGRSA